MPKVKMPKVNLEYPKLWRFNKYAEIVVELTQETAYFDDLIKKIKHELSCNRPVVLIPPKELKR